jgi:hypothetical protein
LPHGGKYFKYIVRIEVLHRDYIDNLIRILNKHEDREGNKDLDRGLNKKGNKEYSLKYIVKVYNNTNILSIFVLLNKISPLHSRELIGGDDGNRTRVKRLTVSYLNHSDTSPRKIIIGYRDQTYPIFYFVKIRFYKSGITNKFALIV